MGSGFLYAYYPVFWAIPTMMLSEAAAAATFGLINFIGQLGGFAGNYAIGLLNESNAFACSQLRVHSARLCCGGRLDP
jgi:ACS family tartrate transporter-like MFS transporter